MIDEVDVKIAFEDQSNTPPSGATIQSNADEGTMRAFAIAFHRQGASGPRAPA